MLKLTLVEIEALSSAVEEERTEDMNNKLFIEYQNAILTSIATNNPKKFPKKSPRINPKPTIKDGVANPKDIYDRIWQIAAMCGMNSK